MDDDLQLVRLVRAALRNRASDVHITPGEAGCALISHRIDGDLHLHSTIPAENFTPLAISIKVSAKLDIAETRRPQSGHVQLDGVDLRISTHPTIYGENIVIRVLSKEKALISIENLGFAEEQISYLKRISAYQHGMIIFCGPTGSGKTTSIYALLEIMDKSRRNVMTLEDPVEYKISGVRQTEIRRGVIGFVDGVRSILRQDPDVILIGEIRDEETAKMAIRASMTGHLVLTTIHANDSFGAISRLCEFGVLAALVADNVIAIISQRLAKKAGGGRCAVSEILKCDQQLGDMIQHGSSKRDLQQYAREKLGYVSIAEDIEAKTRAGLLASCDPQVL